MKTVFIASHYLVCFISIKMLNHSLLAVASQENLAAKSPSLAESPKRAGEVPTIQRPLAL